MSLKNPYDAATDYDLAVAWNQGVIDVLEEMVSEAAFSAGTAAVRSSGWMKADAQPILEAARATLSQQWDRA